MQLLYATTNQGKLSEAKQALSEYEVLSLSDFPQLSKIDVEETGTTFRENALLKAKTYGDLAGVMTIGEDAGLIVDALDGRPGVHSARYAPTDVERNTKLLAELGSTPNRSARFVTSLCLYNPKNNEIHYFDGVIEGTIALEPRGNKGFGYDPVFIPEGRRQTFAELGSEVKNTLSHRAQAITALKLYLHKKILINKQQ